MVHVRDGGAAAWLHELINTIAKYKSARLALKDKDIRYPLDKQSTLLVDAGLPDQSLIFQEALHLIDEAKQWLVITCQFLPSGVTGKHLARAQKRGVAVYSIFNHPLRRDKVTLPAQYLIHAREKLRAPRDLFQAQLPFSHRRLHMKLIATEQGAMVGSHNYLSSGVKLGTAEIALLCLEPTFARQSVSLLLSQLAPGSRSYQLLKDFGR